jgi:amidase
MQQISSAPLWQWDAADLVPLIRSGKASAREVVASALARMDAVNPALNAVVRPLHDEALAAADQADAARRRGDALGPLHGVPVTTKVNTDQRGHPTDNGVVAYRDNIAQEDAPVIANLRRAGAIVIGRTNTPCYSMRWFTDNALHGKTANPWGADTTPGGSSGGAGSATAAGIGAIAQGNDIAGSVRYPAFCCGLVGLRPSYGRVPSFNATAGAPQPVSAQFMAVQGPLARRVRDVRLGFAAMAQPDPRDPRGVVIGDQPQPAHPLRAAIVTDPGGLGVHPAIAAAIRQAGHALEQAGYIVEEVEPPELQHTASLWETICMPDTIARLEPLVAENGDEGIRRGLGFWRACWPERDLAACLAGLAERHRLLRLWQMFFQTYPVLVLPVSTQLPFGWDEDTRDHASAARIVESQRGMLAISVLGLPGLSVPTGTADGLPVGVQVVAGPCREDLCFDAAEIIEQFAPMPTPIDPRP